MVLTKINFIKLTFLLVKISIFKNIFHCRLYNFLLKLKFIFWTPYSTSKYKSNANSKMLDLHAKIVIIFSDKLHKTCMPFCHGMISNTEMNNGDFIFHI